jgi:hypothetical protein
VRLENHARWEQDNILRSPSTNKTTFMSLL